MKALNFVLFGVDFDMLMEEKQLVISWYIQAWLKMLEIPSKGCSVSASGSWSSQLGRYVA